MVLNIHAGHNPAGKIGSGANSILNESTENRNVVRECISLLRSIGHTVYDCTVDNGTSQSDILKKIVAKCNSHQVDADISVHFNAGANNVAGNGRSTGTEVFLFNSSSPLMKMATNIVNSISNLGFTNRGVKYSQSLYVLKNTKSPAMLIECCFVDDADDAKLYNAKSMASAIVKGITGVSVVPSPTPIPTPAVPSTTLYRVQVGAYSQEGNALIMRDKLLSVGAGKAIISKATSNGKLIYRVQVGAYSIEANAIARKNELKNKYNIDSIIMKS